MIAKRHFKWLPNALTISRMLLAVIVCYLAAHDRWVPAFWLLIIALWSDFLDGLAAKKLNAVTKIGIQLDRRADAAISAGAFIGLAIAGLFPWWGVVVAPFIAAFLAEERLFWPKTGWLHQHRPLLSVGYLFFAWIFVSWVYIDQAFGWSWWYVPLTFALLGLSASLKRHRLRAWFLSS